MFRFILNSPILVLSGLCLLLFVSADIFFNAAISFTAVHYLLMSLLLILCHEDFIKRMQATIVALLFLGFYIYSAEKDIILLLSEIINIIFLAKDNPNKNSHLFAFVALSFALHLYYIQNTDVDTRQHDLSGIFFYINDITLHGINFMHFNPWRMYYLFHQPLHFIIYGYIYFAELSFSGSNIVAQEGLQYVSLYCVTLATLLAIKIFSKFNFDINIFLFAVILFSFNPTLFLFSGYISDDVLVFLFSLAFLYYLICWYQNSNSIDIIKASVFFGFGVLTKLSILIMVPAICLLFAYKFFYSNDKKKIIEDVSIFIIIAVPLSLIWILRNHILFDMSFTNIPDTSPSGQNFKYMTFGDRITDFSAFLSPFITVPQTVDSNMWLAIIKTELFGEWDFSVAHPFAHKIAFMLYIFNLFLKICALFCCLFILVRFIMKRIDFLPLFFVLIYFTVWIYSFKYALDYPFACSTDYRLFSILMIPEIIIISSVLKNKYRLFFLLFAFIYALCSSLIYSLAI